VDRWLKRHRKIGALPEGEAWLLVDDAFRKLGPLLVATAAPDVALAFAQLEPITKPKDVLKQRKRIRILRSELVRRGLLEHPVFELFFFAQEAYREGQKFLAEYAKACQLRNAAAEALNNVS
jgi:hypothetical protein